MRSPDSDIGPPSAWVRGYSALIPHGRVLDLACGRGRHARFLAQAGWQVLAVDRNAESLAALHALSGVETRLCDLEGPVWPLAGERFDGVVVTHYLHRARRAELMALLKPGGVLIYETFMQGYERFGRPSRADFLLRPGELLDWAQQFDLEVLAFEQAEVRIPREACLQRLCARRPCNAAMLVTPNHNGATP